MLDVQYKIIGGDDTEYGPTTLAELKSWIRDGRVAGMTKVWRSDLSMWSPADRYTELFEELARQHAARTAAEERAQPAARFWVRLVAYVIDMALLTLIFMVIWTPLAEAHHWQLPEIPTNLSDAAFQQYLHEFVGWRDKAFPVFYPIFLLYDVLLNGRFGATLGKMAVGARITLLDGSPIGYGRALLRWVAARLSDIAFIGYLLIGLRHDKRALHDLLAGTKVVLRR
jgi:uncharacterized RDD family membrane protein YckC